MSELLTVSQVAEILKCSEDTVVRRFSRMKGVLNIGTEGTLNKHRCRQLRIPVSLLEKYVGHPVTVPPVQPKQPRERTRDGRGRKSDEEIASDEYFGF